MRSTLTALVVITAVATATLPCLAQDAAIVQPAQQHPRTISTTGESVVYVVPDEVVVGFGIETFNADLDKAKADNDQRAKRLLAAVKELKVEDKHVQSDVMQVSIEYQDHRRHVVGYTCRRAYSVTLKNVKQFEQLVDAALKNGANQITGFEFKTTELRKHRDQARKMAVQAAREKATDLAGALECKIGKPRTINEGYGYSGYGGGWGRGGSMAGNSFQNAIQVAGNAGGTDGEQTIPLGQIGVRATISVTFDLVP